jgi:ABC-type sugar transport system ATPase subunit
MSGTLTPPLLRIEELSKAFPGTRALDAVSLGVAKGEVHALLGANGSGKSTLIKVLAGYHRADPGARAWMDEDELDLVSPGAPRHEGLRFVHQDLGIVLELDAVDNFGLHAGFQTARGGRVRWRDAARRTRHALERFGMDIDLRKPMADAAPVERTVVAIAAAIEDWEADGGLLVLDEPTAALPPTEVAILFDLVAEVRRAGASVLYVSHRLDEIFQIAHRVTVLRTGRLVGTRDVDDLVPRDVIEMMIGSAVDTDIRPNARAANGDSALLEARGLHGRFLHGVDLTVGPGEIVGVAGLLGSGREEIPYVLAGASEAAGACGTIRHRTADGEPGAWADVADAKTRLPLVPADRGRHGVVAEMTIRRT